MGIVLKIVLLIYVGLGIATVVSLLLLLKEYNLEENEKRRGKSK